jgi:hypothetical protein
MTGHHGGRLFAQEIVVKARHRMPSSRRTRALTGLGALVVATAGVIGGGVGPASADITRCIGAVETPGAFVCYTSPRFNQSGFQQTDVAAFPVVCFAVGCTGSVLWAYTPSDYINGRFTSVFYLDHTYTVYRPATDQPYILTSDNPRLDPATQAQVLILSMALDAANGL